MINKQLTTLIESHRTEANGQVILNALKYVELIAKYASGMPAVEMNTEHYLAYHLELAWRQNPAFVIFKFYKNDFVFTANCGAIKELATDDIADEELIKIGFGWLGEK